MKLGRIAALAAAGAALVLLSGCGPALIRVEEPARTESRAIELGGAEALDAELRFGIGELKVTGGATKAMEATFDYRPESWKPDVRYSVEGTAGMLRVEQPDPHGTPILTSTRNSWDVRLNDSVPLNLRVKSGVGETTLDLGGLSLRRLDVVGGAGDTEIDLGTTAEQDLSVDITAGVGEVVLRVPREAGVRVWGYQDGVGSFDAEGFTRDGGENALLNENYGKAGVKRYDIRIQRGVGDVTIEQR